MVRPGLGEVDMAMLCLDERLLQTREEVLVYLQHLAVSGHRGYLDKVPEGYGRTAPAIRIYQSGVLHDLTEVTGLLGGLAKEVRNAAHAASGHDPELRRQLAEALGLDPKKLQG